MSSQHRTGLLLVLIAAAGYAFLPIITRAIYANSDFSATDIAIWRFAFATPVIWVWILLRERMTGEKPGGQELPIHKALILGGLYAASAVGAFIGLSYIPASTFIVLFYTYPAMVALMAVALGTPLRRTAWIALALTLAGIIFTVPDFSLEGTNVTLGVVAAFGNAFVVAVYFMVVSRFMNNSGSSGRGTARIITGALVVLVLLIPIVGLRVPPTPIVWGLLLVLAIFSTSMSIFLMVIGIRLIGPATAAIISTGEPVMTIILAVVLLGETVLPVQWFGAVLIVAGVIILEWRPRQKSAELPSS
jgi:drug/metabolite transporter (DMT)-like permease